MKKIRLIVVGIALSVMLGCAAVKEAATTAISFTEVIHTLKTKGCDALSEPVKASLVRLIKTRLDNYPENGICNPKWVRDVLLKQIEKLERTYAIYNGPAPMGHSAGSGNGSLDQPNRAALFLATFSSGNYRTSRLQNRSGIGTKARSLVYASSIKAHSSSGSHTRLHLHGPLQRDKQSTS
jgi:hypothetical protein